MRSGVVMVACAALAAGCATLPVADPRTIPTASARIILPSRTVTAGSQMPGRVVVDNNTGEPIHAHGCGSLFAVVLTSSTYHPDLTNGTCSQNFTIPAGKSDYPVRVLASYLACNVGGAPACPPGKQPIPPLPPGHYYAKLVFLVHPFAPAPPAIPVRVTPK